MAAAWRPEDTNNRGIHALYGLQPCRNILVLMYWARMLILNFLERSLVSGPMRFPSQLFSPTHLP
eukprot:12275706-Prorocentrum_lima.AAC.1